MKERYTVTGIGELLWDMFPAGPRLGGAPLNFCYHCQQLGAQGYPVSAVGVDDLGIQLRSVLRTKAIPEDYVVDIPDHPTGTVEVTLDEKGHPTYTIKEGVAWDLIPQSASLDRLARESNAVCFGSLAQRSDVSRETIITFLQAMRPTAIKIFDINLRQHFYSKAIVQGALTLCNMLKLSDEELPVLAGIFGLPGSVTNQLGALLERFQLRLIAYTRGVKGSLLMTPNQADDHPGFQVETANTVGAGDAFTAALCMGLLNEIRLEEINEHANRVASFVCSRDGATPVLPEETIEGMTHAK